MMKKFETWGAKGESSQLTVPESLCQSREFFLCSCVGSLWDILGMGRIILHTRSFVNRMVLRRLHLMLFAGYLCPFICFSFPCGLNVGACHSIKASGKSLLSVPHPGQCVFAWHVSSLHLLFCSPHLCHPRASVLGSVNSALDAQSSSARLLKDREFSLPSSMTSSSNVTIRGFLTSGLLHGYFFPQCEQLPSITGWAALGFWGRLQQHGGHL